MLFFLDKGYRVIAHDRRGHGRSTQTGPATRWTPTPPTSQRSPRTLDLKDAVHIGHSTGGGEVARYVARHGKGRVAKAVLIGAVPPIMVKTAANPGGLPIEVFDGFRAALAANRAQFFRDVPDWPVLRLQPPRREGPSHGVIAKLVAAGHDGRRLRRITTASRRFRRPTSPKISRRSSSNARACTARTIRSCRSPTARCSRSSS